MRQKLSHAYLGQIRFGNTNVAVEKAPQEASRHGHEKRDTMGWMRIEVEREREKSGRDREERVGENFFLIITRRAEQWAGPSCGPNDRRFSRKSRCAGLLLIAVYVFDTHTHTHYIIIFLYISLFRWSVCWGIFHLYSLTHIGDSTLLFLVGWRYSFASLICCLAWLAPWWVERNV